MKSNYFVCPITFSLIKDKIRKGVIKNTSYVQIAFLKSFLVDSFTISASLNYTFLSSYNIIYICIITGVYSLI